MHNWSKQDVLVLMSVKRYECGYGPITGIGIYVFLIYIPMSSPDLQNQEPTTGVDSGVIFTWLKVGQYTIVFRARYSHGRESPVGEPMKRR